MITNAKLADANDISRSDDEMVVSSPTPSPSLRLDLSRKRERWLSANSVLS